MRRPQVRGREWTLDPVSSSLVIMHAVEALEMLGGGSGRSAAARWGWELKTQPPAPEIRCA